MTIIYAKNPSFLRLYIICHERRNVDFTNEPVKTLSNVMDFKPTFLTMYRRRGSFLSIFLVNTICDTGSYFLGNYCT